MVFFSGVRCLFVERYFFVGLDTEFVFEAIPGLVVFVGAAVYDGAPFIGVGLWRSICRKVC